MPRETLSCPAGKRITYAGVGKRPTRCDECREKNRPRCADDGTPRSRAERAEAATQQQLPVRRQAPVEEPPDVEYEVTSEPEPPRDWMQVVERHDFLSGSAIAHLLDVPDCETAAERLEKLEAARAFLDRAIQRARASLDT